MDTSIEENKSFLSDLFAGPFRGHAIIMDAEPVEKPFPGDFITSERPVRDWLPWMAQTYEKRVRYHEAVGDDSVPYLKLWTGTEIFAAAFGCPAHVYDDSPPSARPLVRTAEEADRLRVPDMSAPPIRRVFELASLTRDRLGPDAPISVPDIQSAFDIAALIWRKEDLYLALLDRPDAVKRLVDKCQRHLKLFLTDFKKQFPNCNLCHCPTAWAPPEQGCWLSEDEAGSMSVTMFEEFCLPNLVELSETFGGLFMHCCARADHQYPSFRKIPNLRGLNRVFQAPGPRPAIEAFSGQTVLMVAWTDEKGINDMLDMALPDTRFLFNVPAQPLEEAKRTFEGLRKRCPRTSG